MPSFTARSITEKWRVALGNSTKGESVLRSCTNTLYKIDSSSSRDSFKNVFNWKVLRWALIPAVILILLALTVYSIVVLGGDEPLLVDSGESVASLLDLGAHSTYAKPPGGKVEEAYTKWNESNPEEELSNLSNVSEQPNGLADEENDENSNGNDTDLMYSDGDMTFIDRLISSFRDNAQGEEVDSAEGGLSMKQLSSLAPGVRIAIQNGHKYGEYQGVAGLSKYIDYSTTSLPVSPTLPSLPVRSQATTNQPPNNHNESSACYSPRLSMCRGVLPWDLTTLPNTAGMSSTAALHDALPYFELVAQSGCSPRSRQFLCTVLEPQCQPMGAPILPPCRKLCRAVAEECSDFVLDLLDLSQIFNCDNYPDSEDPGECVNLARGGSNCLKKELMCEDGSCIPQRWKCDGVKDCPGGADEDNCTFCSTQQFTCKSHDRCIPLSWRCDGRPDCPDRSDEFNCQQMDYESMSHSHASPCPSGELRCVDGRCITVQQICDGAKDCSDGADEVNCRSSLGRVPFT